MDALAVPKRTAAVSILLSDGSGGNFALFLADRASRHDGPEEVADLLAAKALFLPARDVTNSRIAFLRREAIVLVEAASEEDADPFSLAGGEQHQLEVRLAGGRVIRGFVSFVPPPDRARLLDHLNEPDAFLALHGEGIVSLVQKRHVTRVDVLER